MGIVKFGINTMSVALKMGKISQGEAERNFHFQCSKSGTYLPQISLLYPCYSQLIPILAVFTHAVH